MRSRLLERVCLEPFNLARLDLGSSWQPVYNNFRSSEIDSSSQMRANQRWSRQNITLSELMTAPIHCNPQWSISLQASLSPVGEPAEGLDSFL